MPHRRTAVALPKILAFLVALSGFAPARAADDLGPLLNDAGEIHLPKGALSGQDYLIAAYVERPQDLSSSVGGADGLPGTLPAGCLPLVEVNTASGHPRLNAPAEVTFGCAGLPASATIYAYRHGQWQPVPSERTDDGRVSAHFQDTAIFGVFLPPENNSPQI